MHWLITGGAGFIGTNLACHLLAEGHHVTIIDDLSREGVSKNAEYLSNDFNIDIKKLDVTNTKELLSQLDRLGHIDTIAHLAGQVSFMESISNPRRDFEINGLGTLNILEFVRNNSPDTTIIGMSSNKIYGSLDEVKISIKGNRYHAPEWPVGFNESLQLDFQGPYGCSKGVADQYLADYARIYNLKTASLRQSSVYGPFQHPRTDQGWVAFFVNEFKSGKEIALNGRGLQVRDLLHVKDLANLFSKLAPEIGAGEINQFNVGGGSENSFSILELFEYLEKLTGRKAELKFGFERPSDQKVFISDNSKVSKKANWKPQISKERGIVALVS
jgi:CDP-paratose 2-epimerase